VLALPTLRTNLNTKKKHKKTELKTRLKKLKKKAFLLGWQRRLCKVFAIKNTTRQINFRNAGGDFFCKTELDLDNPPGDNLNFATLFLF
jgi:hypothetical protein